MDIEIIKEAAQEVFNELGSGHSETVYETALAVELLLRGMRQRCQVPCVIDYKGCNIGIGHIDLLVDELVVVEIKSVAKLSRKDEQQLRKYLTATGLDRGLLINYGNDLEFVEVGKQTTYDQTTSAEDRN